MTDQQERAVSAILLIGMICMLLIIVWTPLLIEAGPFMSVQSPPVSEQSIANEFKLTHAYIELQVNSTQPDLWAAVQQQTSGGEWQPVESWQGYFNEAGIARQPVSTTDFGTGPFRWVVLDKPNGTVLATSEPFHLPTLPNETMLISLELDHHLLMTR